MKAFIEEKIRVGKPQLVIATGLSAMLSLDPDMDYDGISPIIEGIINDKES